MTPNWRVGSGTLLRNAAAIRLAKLFSSSSARSSSSKLFVGGLSYDTNETALKDAFSRYGHVTAVKVICHPTTGRSKGFGFVVFSSQDDAAAAVHKMNGEASAPISSVLLSETVLTNQLF
nr:unnamed protein product [Digitaria exilis]